MGIKMSNTDISNLLSVGKCCRMRFFIKWTQVCLQYRKLIQSGRCYFVKLHSNIYIFQFE
jgi:hypothetical protein